MNELKYSYYWNKKAWANKKRFATYMEVTIWTKLIDFKSPLLSGDLKPYQ